jgi:hypothetical protein
MLFLLLRRYFRCTWIVCQPCLSYHC